MSFPVPMHAPAHWPFASPIVPAHLMPSGTPYVPNSEAVIFVSNSADVGALIGYGFCVFREADPIDSITVDLNALSEDILAIFAGACR